MPIERVGSVVVSRIVANPAAYEPGGPVHQAILTIGWGAMGRLDLEPASCADPNCDADHGYTGTFSADDVTAAGQLCGRGRRRRRSAAGIRPGAVRGHPADSGPLTVTPADSTALTDARVDGSTP